MPAANVAAEETSAAFTKFGSAAKYVKWGGRTLLVVAVASNIYEVYQSENKPRTITKIIGGWRGAAIASTAAGLGLSAFEIAPGPGTLLHGIATFGAGVLGYWGGTELSEKVYDYVFEKVK